MRTLVTGILKSEPAQGDIMLIEIAEKGMPLSKPDDPIWTTTIITYELGSVIRALTKARNKKEFGDIKGQKAYLSEARIEFADMLTQCHLLAEQMGWSLVDLKNDGYERFEERMKEYEEGIELAPE